jgi:hypothetical protein
MRTFVAAALAAALATGAAAQALPVAYTWTGNGVSVPGSSKCATYKMTIDVAVDGNIVRGVFMQQGREQRRFEAALGAGGSFKTKAQLGAGETMDVKGTISDAGSTVTLDGYCKFGGKLTKK